MVVGLTAGRGYLPWVILAVIALAVPWLPAAWQLWTTALVPGCLLACVIQTLRVTPVRRTSEAGGTALTVAQPAIPIWFWMLVASAIALAGATFGRSSFGQEVATASEMPPRLIKVIIPVDREGKPSRDLVFLPKEFLDQLLKSAPRSSASLPWIVESVRHVVDIESNPFSEQTRWRLTSRFQLRTLQPDVRFPLPYSADQVLVFADQIELDQGIARVVGTPDSGLQASIETPGLHELVVKGVLLIPNDVQESFAWEPPFAPDTEFRINGLAASGWELESSTAVDSSTELGVDRIRLIGPRRQLQFRPRPSSDATPTVTPELGIAEVLQSDGDRLIATIWFRPTNAASWRTNSSSLSGPDGRSRPTRFLPKPIFG